LSNDVPEMVDAFYWGDATSKEGKENLSGGAIV